ncbi:hypothetical protein QAD02_021201 [Eretmocerus hayati]|uniref:Uncharacterized protein n=1 Tax=Eretmocerus hayati TaxID=131215 RepID=A0ACC2PQW5_9HYME|nr:hypothetical protein QAD02_021201 [Eretmocerus hayati]
MTLESISKPLGNERENPTSDLRFVDMTSFVPSKSSQHCNKLSKRFASLIFNYFFFSPPFWSSHLIGAPLDLDPATAKVKSFGGTALLCLPCRGFHGRSENHVQDYRLLAKGILCRLGVILIGGVTSKNATEFYLSIIPSVRKNHQFCLLQNNPKPLHSPQNIPKLAQHAGYRSPRSPTDTALRLDTNDSSFDSSDHSICLQSLATHFLC